MRRLIEILCARSNIVARFVDNSETDAEIKAMLQRLLQDFDALIILLKQKWGGK